MSLDLHGESCTIVLFIEPDGELESLVLVVGTLDCTGDVPMLRPDYGGEAARIPEHLMDWIQLVTDEHRECMEELTTPYCLCAFYDGRLNEEHVDVSAVLASCYSESRQKDEPPRQTVAGRILSFVRGLFGRDTGQ